MRSQLLQRVLLARLCMRSIALPLLVLAEVMVLGHVMAQAKSDEAAGQSVVSIPEASAGQAAMVEAAHTERLCSNGW